MFRHLEDARNGGMGAMKGRLVSARGFCGTNDRSAASRIAGFRSSKEKFVSGVVENVREVRLAQTAPFVRFAPTGEAAMSAGASDLSCVVVADARRCTRAAHEALADALRARSDDGRRSIDGRPDPIRRAPDQMMWAGHHLAAIDRPAAADLRDPARERHGSMVPSATAVRGVKKKASEGWRTLQGLSGAVEVGEVPRRLLAMARTEGVVPGVDVADRGVSMGFAPR